MKLGKQSYKALSIIKSFQTEGILARVFARRMWPDNDLWNVPNNAGKQYGYKLVNTALSYLARLAKHGYIQRGKKTFNDPFRYYLTDKGHNALKLWENNEYKKSTR